tara:strand:+ start:5978 stop:6409 length:432 start_codon:yes stop_codon:yes gene_type:complete
VSLAAIAERQDISLSYLEQLFAGLRRDGLVVGFRGPRGGYRLGGRPEDISVAQITAAVSENMDTTRCQGEGNCQHGAICLTHHLWEALNEHIRGYLQGITLADVMARVTESDGSSRSGQEERIEAVEQLQGSVSAFREQTESN